MEGSPPCLSHETSTPGCRMSIPASRQVADETTRLGSGEYRVRLTTTYGQVNERWAITEMATAPPPDCKAGSRHQEPQ